MIEVQIQKELTVKLTGDDATRFEEFLDFEQYSYNIAKKVLEGLNK